VCWDELDTGGSAARGGEAMRLRAAYLQNWSKACMRRLGQNCSRTARRMHISLPADSPAGKSR